MAIGALAAFRAALYAGHVRAGLLVAVASSVIGGVPFLLLLIGAITGTAGAIVGKGVAWSRRRAV